MEDLRPQLLGRGTYGPHRQPRRDGPMHLWDHVSSPPAQNSLIIYTDGTVVEGNNFASWEYDPLQVPDVHRFILGGTNIREGDLDDFSKNALIAAGYDFGFETTLDVYVADYTDEYPLSPSGSGVDPAAAAEAVRLARIAALEAELAALRGTP